MIAAAKLSARELATLAFSYLRFSTRKQAKGDSQRRQTELANAYCRRRGWTLSQQTYQDLGVSAFRGKNALVGNLGEFLKAVERGAVPAGSALIVESLDRITRQGIDEGYDVVKKILKAGILLVTLTPEREFDAGATKSLSKGALEIQLILERAAEESERKSERIRAAWAGKRKKARESGALVAASVPAWIEKRDGKLRLIPERAKAVKRIFALAAAGYGRSRIIQTLKAEGIPPFGVSKEWPSCSIGFILTDRRALGLYQPRKTCSTAGGAEKRVPDGEPIANYYPAVVSEKEWRAARAGMRQRRRAIGGRKDPWTGEEDELVRDPRLSVAQVARKTKRSRAAVYQRRHALELTVKQRRAGEGNFVNLFTGLIRDALPPYGNYIAVSRMDAKGPAKALLNGAHAEGKAPCRLFPLAVFEPALLGALREVDPGDVLPPRDDARPDPVAQLQGELAGVEAELAEANAFMDANGFSPTIGKRVVALETRKANLGAELRDAQARADRPAEQCWREYGSLVDALEAAPDPRDARVRLRAALGRIVGSISLLVVRRNGGRSADKLAAVQVHFRGGARREYLIHYRPAGRTWPGAWRVRSFDTPNWDPDTPAKFGVVTWDLTDPGQARFEADDLSGLDSETLEEMFAGCPLRSLP